MSPVVKTCACGISFTLDEWLALRYVGKFEGCSPTMRNCRCGSTIAFDEDSHAKRLDEEAVESLQDSPWERAEREAKLDNMFAAAVVDGTDDGEREASAPAGDEGWDWEVLR